MSAKISAEVYIQPKNSRPLKRTASVTYSNPVELRRQIEAYAATVWTSAKRINVDTSAKEILVDGVALANYAVHIPGQPAPEVTAPARGRRGKHSDIRRYSRETTAQLAVVALGLTLVIAAGNTINGLFVLGFGLTYFGIYRIARGVQQREAAARHRRRDVRTVAELPGSEAAAA